MSYHITNHRRLVAYIALSVLVFAVLVTPAVRTVATGPMALIGITKHILHFPCSCLDHSQCFSLDRFDPTCPQCI